MQAKTRLVVEGRNSGAGGVVRNARTSTGSDTGPYMRYRNYLRCRVTDPFDIARVIVRPTCAVGLGLHDDRVAGTFKRGWSPREEGTWCAH